MSRPFRTIAVSIDQSRLETVRYIVREDPDGHHAFWAFFDRRLETRSEELYSQIRRQCLIDHRNAKGTE